MYNLFDKFTSKYYYRQGWQCVAMAPSLILRAPPFEPSWPKLEEWLLIWMKKIPFEFDSYWKFFGNIETNSSRPGSRPEFFRPTFGAEISIQRLVLTLLIIFNSYNSYKKIRKRTWNVLSWQPPEYFRFHLNCRTPGRLFDANLGAH